MKLKTKFDKHAQDNQKRRNALNEKAKVKSNQLEIIKQALSTANLHQGSAKKILFDNDDDQSYKNTTNGGTHDSVKSRDKLLLFDEAGSEEEDTISIKEKSQFSGKQGYELLKLQSSYGNDDRFKIDDRFLDEEESNAEGVGNQKNGQKNKQLKILDDVLGKSSSAKKSKKRTFEMVRYDASNKDHEKHEIKPDEEDSKKLNKTKKKKIRDKTYSETNSTEKKPPVIVSKEKFYQVSKDIKDSFKSRKVDESGGFSLLQAYGQNGIEDADEYEEEEHKKEEDETELPSEAGLGSEEYTNLKNASIKVTSTEISNQLTGQSQVAVARGVWKESFFFAHDDPRLQEALQFINKKNSEEAEKTAENYDAVRKKLREIIRLHNKKLLAKKDPFKKKIGGMNKKQLANSKLKRDRKPNRTFNNKKRPPKMNPHGRF